MNSTFAKIYELLTAPKRKAALVLLSLIIVGTVFEVLGISLLLPVISLLMSDDLAVSYPALQPLLDALGNPEPVQQYLLLSVTNPGPPLPDRMRSQLFDSMVSVRGAEGSRHLGLGLYVAKLIAEGHGGNITADNVEGGVRFEVRLPA